jgi:hypothetical protein
MAKLKSVDIVLDLLLFDPVAIYSHLGLSNMVIARYGFQSGGHQMF